MGSWETRSSQSSLRTDPCRECLQMFDRWTAGEMLCRGCRNKLIGKYRDINFSKTKAFFGNGHSVTTIDKKDYYIDEYAQKGIYKKYIDYEEQEKKPLLHKMYLEHEKRQKGTNADV